MVSENAVYPYQQGLSIIRAIPATNECDGTGRA
jgi:hypothetical protein